jgi:hypothetical protein
LQQQRGKVFTLDEFHNQELAQFIGEVINDFGERTVAHTGKQLRFTLKRAPGYFSLNESLFERNGIAQARVNCFVDSAHTTAANLRHDLVASLECGIEREHGQILRAELACFNMSLNVSISPFMHNCAAKYSIKEAV